MNKNVLVISAEEVESMGNIAPSKNKNLSFLFFKISNFYKNPYYLSPL